MEVINKSSILRMVRTDFARAFLSPRFVISVAAGMGVCYFTMLFCGFPGPTVHMFVYMHDKSQIFLALIIGVLPYSACFYADFLHGNIRNVLGRAHMGGYVFSKSAAAVASSVTAFVCGKLIFTAFYSMGHPVCLPGTLDALPGSLLYGNLAEEGHYFTFFLLASLHRALYCGVLCQVVMLVSVWVPNLSVMFSIPVGVFYVVNFHLRNITKAEYLNLSRIFSGTTRVWASDAQNFAYAVAVAAVLYLILFRATLWSMRRKIYHV